MVPERRVLTPGVRRQPTADGAGRRVLAPNPGETTLLRSTDNGANWTVGWTAPAVSKRFLGPQSVVRDDNTGYLYLIEYSSNAADTTGSIWRSTDEGVTWAAWVTRNTSPTDPDKIHHWHSARYDSVSQRMYCFAGDTNANAIAGMYRANAASTDVEPVSLNSPKAPLFPRTRPPLAAWTRCSSPPISRGPPTAAALSRGSTG